MSSSHILNKVSMSTAVRGSKCDCGNQATEKRFSLTTQYSGPYCTSLCTLFMATILQTFTVSWMNYGTSASSSWTVVSQVTPRAQVHPGSPSPARVNGWTGRNATPPAEPVGRPSNALPTLPSNAKGAAWADDHVRWAASAKSCRPRRPVNLRRRRPCGGSAMMSGAVPTARTMQASSRRGMLGPVGRPQGHLQRWGQWVVVGSWWRVQDSALTPMVSLPVGVPSAAGSWTVHQRSPHPPHHSTRPPESHAHLPTPHPKVPGDLHWSRHRARVPIPTLSPVRVAWRRQVGVLLHPLLSRIHPLSLSVHCGHVVRARSPTASSLLWCVKCVVPYAS
eukprot:m.73277 g.73277  ORF g.73277 m.73277 type:complete len:335 (+) comp8827_c0_seq2:631-1635(+)